MYQEAKEGMIINQVIDFAEKTIEIASNHKFTALAAWADKLRNQAVMFDMAAVEQTLSGFQSFLERRPK